MVRRKDKMYSARQPICPKCAKELNSGSRTFQKWRVLYGTSTYSVGYTTVWREVRGHRRGIEKGTTPEQESDILEEMTLCSSCANQFQEKLRKQEWRSLVVLAVPVIFGIFAFIILIVYSYWRATNT